MTATARVARTSLPWPNTTADVADKGWGGDFEAVDALWAAYMALNATGYGDLATDAGPTSPMRLTARAAIAALSTFPGVSPRDARRIWEAMCDGADTALHGYTLWRNGEI